MPSEPSAPGRTRGGLARHVGALVISLLGTLGVVGLSLGMNAQVEKKAPELESAVELMAAAPERQSRSTPRKARSSPVKKAARAAPSAAPALAAGLAGLDFGLDRGADAAMVGATSALLDQVGTRVMSEEEVEEPPRPTEQRPPTFPARARQNGQTGRVTVSFVVDIDGSVEDLHIVESVPPGVFDAAALEAASGWTFDPGLQEGAPVAVRVRQTLRFELE